MNPEKILYEILELAHKAQIIELLFLSGVGTLITTSEEKQFFELDNWSRKFINNLHYQCLASSYLNHLVSKKKLKYNAHFSRYGTFSCTYIYRRNTANLRIKKNIDAQNHASVIRTPPEKPFFSATLFFNEKNQKYKVWQLSQKVSTD